MIEPIPRSRTDCRGPDRGSRCLFAPMERFGSRMVQGLRRSWKFLGSDVSPSQRGLQFSQPLQRPNNQADERISAQEKPFFFLSQSAAAVSNQCGGNASLIPLIHHIRIVPPTSRTKQTPPAQCFRSSKLKIPDITCSLPTTTRLSVITASTPLPIQ